MLIDIHQLKLTSSTRSNYYKILHYYRETEEKTFSGQRDTCRRITERLNDITFWRNELATEFERMLTETHQLQDVRRAVEKANQDCDPPLQMAQECLYHREGRQGKLSLKWFVLD